MITLQNAATCIVSNDSGALVFPAGEWKFDWLYSLRPGTNLYVDVSGLRDGAIISVDANGLMTVMDGANWGAFALQGMVVGFMTVGMALLLRWILRRWNPGAME